MNDERYYLYSRYGRCYISCKNVALHPVQKTNKIRSVLYYLPYAVLAAMTFPGIFYSTGNTVTAAVGTLVALVLAYFDLPLIVVAIAAALSAFGVGFLV